MTNYAQMTTRTAPVSSDFGRDYAVRLFGAAILDSLPMFARGPRKGLPKGTLEWTRCVRGGWDHGAVRAPGFVSATLYIDGKRIAETAYPCLAAREAAEAHDRAHRRDCLAAVRDDYLVRVASYYRRLEKACSVGSRCIAEMISEEIDNVTRDIDLMDARIAAI